MKKRIGQKEKNNKEKFTFHISFCDWQTVRGFHDTWLLMFMSSKDHFA